MVAPAVKKRRPASRRSRRRGRKRPMQKPRSLTERMDGLGSPPLRLRCLIVIIFRCTINTSLTERSLACSWPHWFMFLGGAGRL